MIRIRNAMLATAGLLLGALPTVTPPETRP